MGEQRRHEDLGDKEKALPGEGSNLRMVQKRDKRRAAKPLGKTNATSQPMLEVGSERGSNFI